MVTTEAGTGRLILSENGDPRTAYAGMNALSPVLLGLTLPLIAFISLAPVTVKRVGPILIVLLMLLFLVATVVFLISVFVKGPVVALAAAPGSTVLEIYRAGPFATSRDRISIDDVADLRIETVYDQDGYVNRMPQLVLDKDETIGIPITVEDSDVRRFRELIRSERVASAVASRIR